MVRSALLGLRLSNCPVVNDLLQLQYNRHSIPKAYLHHRWKLPVNIIGNILEDHSGQILAPHLNIVHQNKSLLAIYLRGETPRTYIASESLV